MCLESVVGFSEPNPSDHMRAAPLGWTWAPTGLIRNMVFDSRTCRQLWVGTELAMMVDTIDRYGH